MGESYKKQHIVPQAYLKRFAERNSNNKGYHIGVRIIENNKPRLFQKSISQVGYIDNYYDVSTMDNPKYWEHYFASNIEPLYDKPLTNIIARITLFQNNRVLDLDVKRILSKMITFQMCRVPSFLDIQYRNGKRICVDYIQEFLRLYGLKLTEEQRRTMNNIKVDDFVKNATLENLSNPNSLEERAEVLANKTWLVYYNETLIPFVTNDNPIIAFNINDGNVSSGLGRIDNIIVFPLSPKIIVQIFPFSFSESLNEHDGCRYILTDADTKYVINTNMLFIDNAMSQSFIPPSFIDCLKMRI